VTVSLAAAATASASVPSETSPESEFVPSSEEPFDEVDTVFEIQRSWFKGKFEQSTPLLRVRIVLMD
jgi:hypothetical protein